MYILLENVLELPNFHIHFATRNLDAGADPSLRLLIMRDVVSIDFIESRKFNLEKVSASGEFSSGVMGREHPKRPHAEVYASSLKNIRKFATAFLKSQTGTSVPIMSVHSGPFPASGGLTETGLLGHSVFQGWYKTLLTECEEVQRLDVVCKIMNT